MILVTLCLILICYCLLTGKPKSLNQFLNILIAIPWGLLEFMFKKRKCVKDQVVVITGAGSGIGKELVIRFVNMGAKVAAVDINLPACKKVCEDINSSNKSTSEPTSVYDVIALQADVSDPERMRKIAIEIEQHSKLGPVDILVCNAGVLAANLLHKLTDDEIKRSVSVNLLGYFWTVRAFLPQMLQRNRGHIVANVSMTSFMGGKYGAVYSATKFGIRGMMDSLYMELEHSGSKVKTTMVHPYFIRTKLFADGLVNEKAFPLIDLDYAIDKFVDAILLEKNEVSIPSHMMYTTLLAKYSMSCRLRQAIRKTLFGDESVFQPEKVTQKASKL